MPQISPIASLVWGGGTVRGPVLRRMRMRLSIGVVRRRLMSFSSLSGGYTAVFPIDSMAGDYALDRESCAGRERWVKERGVCWAGYLVVLVLGGRGRLDDGRCESIELPQLRH